jgi:alpha-D-xyloside xylohydrolase
MPEWMFGYIHCRERYHSQEEILENAAGFKSRGLPLDVIVQDWQWWGSTGWNSMVFDPEHYPDPRALTDSLHKDNVHLMLSVWSKVDKPTVLGQKLAEQGYYIEGTDWIDFFNPAAADFYVRSFRDSLAIPYGIDAWWFDATEPENDDLAGRLVGTNQVPGEFYRNVYPLLVNRTMYEGLRDLTPEPPVILTRSAFPGIQRYGVVTWSGDVGNDLETLRRQIAGGLGQMACGLPWWTFDAGGFFRPGDQYTSAEYQERLVRWVQVATFLPFMRVHGYMSETEPWRYNINTCAILAYYMDLREKMRPYIVECAHRVSHEGYTLMRPMVFDFADDPEALSREGQYMFGPSLLVNPVTEAGATLWTTYLPANEEGWTDFWTGEHYDGGQWIQTDIDLKTIPLFVRCGFESETIKNL